MSDWLDALMKLERAGEPAILVTVLVARGSTPREAGCKMVVGCDMLFGTIGGGTLEHRCTIDARAMLEGSDTSPIVRDFPLGPALGQCCGGHVSVLFESIRPATEHVVLFGAGHVGRALVRLLGGLPVRVTWIDPRPEAFPPDCPANTECRAAIDIAALPAGSRVLVMTHDHQLDFDIVAAALRRTDLVHVGLIGSATKRARFVSRLARLGIDATRLACPIGLPGIDSKQPAAIAIGVAAQLLATRPSAPVMADADPSSSLGAEDVDGVPLPVMTGSRCIDCVRQHEGVCA